MNNNGLYSSREGRWDTLFGDIVYLGQLSRAKEDFLKESKNTHVGAFNTGEFCRWMHDVWGLDVVVQDGMLSAEYRVYDEQKFILFNLKYTL
jgi:hypothetical protein